MEDDRGTPLEPQQTENLTVEHAANLVFFSFRFSQGDARLQRLIFRYLHLVRPNWRFQEGFEDKIFSLLQERTRRFILPENQGLKYHHHEVNPSASKGVNDTLQEQIENMRKILSDHEPNEEDTLTYRRDYEQGLYNKPKNETTRLITQRIIYQDAKFLIEMGGRKRVGVNPSRLLGDSWSSQLIDYGLKGNPTKVPEYDQMFNDVKDYVHSDHWLDTYWHSEILPNLIQVVDVYNGRHSANEVVDTSFLGSK